MEKILEKIEKKFDDQVQAFETSPVKTTIKWLVVIYILKKVWGWVKDEEVKK